MEVLPRVERYNFDEPSAVEGEDVEFRLIYQGRLPAESRKDSRAYQKHAIRKEFHKQLGELWKQTPALRWQLTEPVDVHKTSHRVPGNPGLEKLKVSPVPGGPVERTFVNYVGDQYNRNGYRFVPLLRKEYGVTCSLDILFLRRDNPGNLVRSGGDIDNRIKVLFDGLKMPSSLEEIGGHPPAPDENPFFCLLEDDSLITGASVTTDRLLLPQATDEHLHEVHLVILVRTKVIDREAFLADIHMS